MAARRLGAVQLWCDSDVGRLPRSIYRLAWHTVMYCFFVFVFWDDDGERRQLHWQVGCSKSDVTDR